MSPRQSESLISSCRCGAVKFEGIGAPIVSASCYCASCQEAGRQIEQRPDAPSVLDADGGTSLVLYRKDRVRCVVGSEHLVEHRLKPSSSTRRMVAGCCNSAMFMELTKGHWLTFYSGRLQQGAPPLEMRVQTVDRPEGPTLPKDIPNYARYSPHFIWKLLVAWIAMGLRTPKSIEGMRQQPSVLGQDKCG